MLEIPTVANGRSNPLSPDAEASDNAIIKTNLGETATAEAQAESGGFFSALMTSGSFMMMQAGAFEEEDLGEASMEALDGLKDGFIVEGVHSAEQQYMD